MSSPMPDAVEAVLAKLARDVETAVHAMYRREVGPSTAKVRTEHFVSDAVERLSAFVKSAPGRATNSPAPRFSAVISPNPAVTDGTQAQWTAEEAAAITKCVMGWLPMGSAKTAAPDSRCMAPGKDLIPTWGEREAARNAIRRVAVG